MEYKIINEKDYPEKLKIIKDCPKKIYATGNINLLYEDCFSIVGTRNPTEYGKTICERFSKEFALRDIPLISGLADGIDKITHQTVLEYNSTTIAVIGCGFKYYINNEENKELFLDIIKNRGLILSEYDLDKEKSSKNFPQRNRIIAALSEGVLVIEASYRSGSSITANFTKKYKKEVFAIPGRIDQKMSVGTNNLIKKGAKLTTEIKDILDIYPQFAKKKRKTIIENKQNSTKKLLKKEWKEIVNLITEDITTTEELQLYTKKDIRVLIKELSEMEIEGIIKQEFGKGYKLVK